MAFTLFKLFRGRKYNVIRKKDDMVSFKASELYFGVLLISMIIFLLPTFAMFYFYVFLCVVLNILCLQVALLACQTLILEFPYFLLAWTRFDDFTLPKSIIFHQLAFKSATPILALHLKHHNNAPFTHLTSQFAKLLKAAASMKMISSIVSG
jgi:phosphatidylinositol glycan class Q protein